MISRLSIAITFLLGTQTVAAHYKQPHIDINVEGTYHSGVFDEGAAEIVAHDPETQRLFVINSDAATVDVLDIQTPSSPEKIASIDATALGVGANSVAVHKGIVAVAIEAEDAQAAGLVAFYNATDLSLLNTVTVGALPDMVTFTPNGRYVLVANEGEPNDDYTVDPAGSVSIIDLKRGVASASVSHAGFERFNKKKEKLMRQGVRIYGPNASVAQDLEPEYIAVSKDSRKAWVSLQENNALAFIDIRKAKVTKIKSLGYKNHMRADNALDASNEDDAINIQNWPVFGMYQPDSIASYHFRGRDFVVTANEGDSRDYDGFSEEERVKDLVLDPVAFPNAAVLQEDENLGRLKTTNTMGDKDGDGDYDRIFSYGARSFSIRNAHGKLIYDSASDFEHITAELIPDDFNSTNDENGSFDNRSDDKGPEPEGLAIGKIKGRTYAFTGLERVGGIMMYDITNPYRVKFVEYFNNRNYDVDAENPDGSSNIEAGDLAPEGLAFMPAHKSPNGKPMLAVGNEVSGTTTLFSIDVSYRKRK